MKVRPTHCKRGHRLKGSNIYQYERDGHIHRSCRICMLDRKQERKATRGDLQLLMLAGHSLYKAREMVEV